MAHMSTTKKAEFEALRNEKILMFIDLMQQTDGIEAFLCDKYGDSLENAAPDALYDFFFKFDDDEIKKWLITHGYLNADKILRDVHLLCGEYISRAHIDTVEFKDDSNKMSNMDDVKSYRIKQGFSQKKFADMFGIPLSTYTQWEQGRRNPPDYIFSMINQILSLTKELNTTKSITYGEALAKLCSYNLSGVLDDIFDIDYNCRVVTKSNTAYLALGTVSYDATENIQTFLDSTICDAENGDAWLNALQTASKGDFDAESYRKKFIQPVDSEQSDDEDDPDFVDPDKFFG